MGRLWRRRCRLWRALPVAIAAVLGTAWTAWTVPGRGGRAGSGSLCGAADRADRADRGTGSSGSTLRRAETGQTGQTPKPQEVQSVQSTSCVSSRGKEIEERLRRGMETDKTGTYLISSRAPVLVAASKDLSPTPVAELLTGDVIEVQQCEVLEEAQRVRGRIENPAGWISLRNPVSGFRWACLKQPQDEIDASLRSLEDLAVKEDTAEAAEANADLLYLRALFGQSTAGLPLLRSFQSSRSWAIFGRGLERWNAVAGDNSFEVPLVVISGQLRREMLRSIDKKKYSQVLVDAYTQEQLQSPGEFKGFSDRFRDVKNRILKDIGGASGLPSSATSATSASDWTQQDIGKWIRVFRDVTSSTRVFQADLYFGHALFGLCLRRLSRRFELALNFEAEAAGDSGDSAVDSNDLGMQSERFANFVEMLAKTNDRALDEVLSLGPNVLAAIRRQTDAIFGKGLRDELQQPIERAIKEIEENPDETPPIAKYTSLLLDAAERGELRMLSVSLEAKERIMMDALTFGVFLQDAEDAQVSRTLTP